MKSIIPKEYNSLSEEERKHIEQYINERSMQSAHEAFDILEADLTARCVTQCIEAATQVLTEEFHWGKNNAKSNDHTLRIDRFKEKLIEKITKDA